MSREKWNILTRRRVRHAGSSANIRPRRYALPALLIWLRRQMYQDQQLHSAGLRRVNAPGGAVRQHARGRTAAVLPPIFLQHAAPRQRSRGF